MACLVSQLALGTPSLAPRARITSEQPCSCSIYLGSEDPLECTARSQGNAWCSRGAGSGGVVTTLWGMEKTEVLDPGGP